MQNLDNRIQELLNDASACGDSKSAQDLLDRASSLAGMMDTNLYNDEIQRIRDDIEHKYDYARGT
jgi:hypothetical protein